MPIEKRLGREKELSTAYRKILKTLGKTKHGFDL